MTGDTRQGLTSARRRSLMAVQEGDGDLLGRETVSELLAAGLIEVLPDGWPNLTDAGREVLSRGGPDAA